MATGGPLRSEIPRLAGDAITLQKVFTFGANPSSTRAEVKGAFRYSGYHPKFAKYAAEHGLAEQLDPVLGC